MSGIDKLREYWRSRQGSGIHPPAGYRTYGRTGTGCSTGTGASMSNSQFAGSGEMITTTLRGYRCWSLGTICTDVTGRTYKKLRSINQGVTWDSSTITAICSKQNMFRKPLGAKHIIGYEREYEAIYEHHAPVAKCTCGIYGWYEPETALLEHTQIVAGVMECTGTITLGTMGFRAQKAKIVAIAPGDVDNITEYVNMRSNDFIYHTQLDHVVRHKNGKMVVDYRELNRAVCKSREQIFAMFMKTLREVGENYGVEVFESIEALKLRYPPQLDTLENVLEGKLKRYDTHTQ